MKIEKIVYLEYVPGVYVDGELSQHKLLAGIQLRFKRDKTGRHHFDALTAEAKDGTPRKWRRLKKAEVDLLIDLSPPPLRYWVEGMRERAANALAVD